ncbi:MAG: hypothetical protein H0W74_08895 [Sphingosinicella sp.]|nr:hypothetical protein [Sphingosinicella sp.]
MIVVKGSGWERLKAGKACRRATISSGIGVTFGVSYDRCGFDGPSRAYCRTDEGGGENERSKHCECGLAEFVQIKHVGLPEICFVHFRL